MFSKKKELEVLLGNELTPQEMRDDLFSMMGSAVKDETNDHQTLSRLWHTFTVLCSATT